MDLCWVEELMSMRQNSPVIVSLASLSSFWQTGLMTHWKELRAYLSSCCLELLGLEKMISFSMVLRLYSLKPPLRVLK